MPDGKTPAPGAHVAFMRKASSDTGMVDTVIADASGHFVVPANLPPGEWSVMFTPATGEPYAAWQESVVIDGDSSTVRSDTLEPAGSVSGIVDLQPSDRYRLEAVSVQLLGTTRIVSADAQGRFSLGRVPSGMYTLQCTVPPQMEDYGPLNKEIYRPNGQDTVLTDTLRLPYLGIPDAEGLQAEFDSLSGIVRLNWNPVREGFEAMILRRLQGSTTKPPDTMAVTKKNVYHDTIFASGTVAGRYALTDTLPIILEYGVLLRDGSQTAGETWEWVEVTAVSPFVYRTVLASVSRSALTMQECRITEIGDTFIIETRFANSRIPIGGLHYYDTAGDSLLFQSVFSPPLLEGNDIVEFECSAAGSYTLLISAVDSVGVAIPFSVDTLKLLVLESLIIGDVTFDGEVDPIDAMAIGQYLEGLRSFTEGERYVADVNQDTYVSIHDASLIACLYVGLIPALPFRGTIGDVNLDGVISAADAGLVANHFNDLAALDQVGQTFADVDGDERVTSNDSLLIMQYIYNEMSEFPYTKK